MPSSDAGSPYNTARWQRLREAVKVRDGYACQACGAKARRLEVDHVVEVKDGGPMFDPANLITLCPRCHRVKTAEEAAKRQAAASGSMCRFHGASCGSRHSKLW